MILISGLGMSLLVFKEAGYIGQEKAVFLCAILFSVPSIIIAVTAIIYSIKREDDVFKAALIFGADLCKKFKVFQ